MEPNHEQSGQYNKTPVFRSGPVSNTAAPSSSRQPNQNRYYTAPGFAQGPVNIGHGDRYENENVDLTIPSAYLAGPSFLPQSRSAPSFLPPALQKHAITGSQAHRLAPLQSRTTSGESSNPRANSFSSANDRAGVIGYTSHRPIVIDDDEDVEMEMEAPTRRQKGKAPIYTEDETLEDAPPVSPEPPARDASPHTPVRDASPQSSTSAEPSSVTDTPGTSSSRAGSGVRATRRAENPKYFRRTSKSKSLKRRPKNKTPMSGRLARVDGQVMAIVEEEWEEKEYPCPYEDCDLISHSQQDIDRHVREKHREVFKCLYCKNTYATAAGRDAHQDQHSQPLKCEVEGCIHVSLTRDGMNRHYKAKHPDMKVDKKTWDEEYRDLCKTRNIADK